MNHTENRGSFRLSTIIEKIAVSIEKTILFTAEQNLLLSQQSLSNVNNKFIVENIRPDVWESIVLLLDDANAVKSRTGTRTEDIATDERVCKIVGAKNLRMIHVDDVTILSSFLGNCYNFFPICDAADLPAVNLQTCRYSTLEIYCSAVYF